MNFEIQLFGAFFEENKYFSKMQNCEKQSHFDNFFPGPRFKKRKFLIDSNGSTLHGTRNFT